MLVTDPHIGYLRRIEAETKERMALWEDTPNVFKYTPKEFQGKGILICAGGPKLIPMLMAQLSYLKFIGNKLPIEVFYADEGEFPEELRNVVMENFPGVCLRNVTTSFLEHPINQRAEYRNMNFRGFQIKPIALWACSFEEVLYIDCDAYVRIHTEDFFEQPGYKKNHSLFYPDFWYYDFINKERASPQGVSGALLNSLYGVQTDRNTLELETGVFVFNKKKLRRTLEALQSITCNYQYYYNIIYGDKDTFRLAAGIAKEVLYVAPLPPGIYGYKDGEGVYGDGMVQFLPTIQENQHIISHIHLTVNSLGDRDFHYNPQIFIPSKDAIIKLGISTIETVLTPLKTATVTLNGSCRVIEVEMVVGEIIKEMNKMVQGFKLSNVYKKYYS